MYVCMYVCMCICIYIYIYIYTYIIMCQAVVNPTFFLGAKQNQTRFAGADSRLGTLLHRY